jgi:hypothetical protein
LQKKIVLLDNTGMNKNGSVAQWLEQGTHKPKVAGSNPARANVQFKTKSYIKSFLNIGEMAEWSKAADC